MQALVVAVVSTVTTVLIVGGWFRKLTKSMEELPKLEQKFGEATVELKGLIASASTLAAEALRVAQAAHARVDGQSTKVDQLRSRSDVIEERVSGQGREIVANQTALMAQLEGINAQLRDALNREIERASGTGRGNRMKREGEA